MIAGKKLHFIGIGGIGMSALAQFCRALGCAVSGSDRGADRPENARILAPLAAQGIAIYPQDGSFIKAGAPDFIVWSSAIEEGNADFIAAGSIARLHRAKALEFAIQAASARCTIAVTGSCGKSSVTAYLTEALLNAGADPSMLNGALSKRFRALELAGNFRPGNGDFLVYEADESDKSLTAFAPDYAIILNMGTDHYGKEELAEVFALFLRNVRRGAVLERGVYEALKPLLPPDLPVVIFESGEGAQGEYALRRYCLKDRVPVAEFSNGEWIALPQPGRHTALNALAIRAWFGMAKKPFTPSLLERFDGIWRRNDFAGRTPSGAMVYDDYAHNPEKIAAAIRAAQEQVPGRVFAVFQPHGYGPLGFMRPALGATIGGVLRPGDEFLFLPPYYAGGSSSFSPTSEEVAHDCRSRSVCYIAAFGDREALRRRLLRSAGADDMILIMGARDNSLSDYAAGFVSSTVSARV